MGTKVPSERASCPQGMHCGAGEMGTDASWISMENDQRCCAVCGESRMHGAKRGAEETYRKATRLVPTQLECGKESLRATRWPKGSQGFRADHEVMKPC